ncbi:MAG TPA: HEAT repeat domain-containing protein [Isosphaeraceae bacterium]|nr:HEAT repeat domain-containing protein [Isosphaeraceae bacterium]
MIDRLRPLARDPDPGVRLLAIETFGPPGHERKMLLAAMGDTDPRVWTAAVHWLWYHRRINGLYALNLTAWLTAASPPFARAEAARALADAAPATVPETLPRLAALLSDPDPEVRGRALTTLGRYGPAAARDALPLIDGPPPDPNDHAWLARLALANLAIDPRRPDPAAWLLVRPPDRASDPAAVQAVLALTREGFDIAPGLAWAVASGPAPARRRALTAAAQWGDDGLSVFSPPVFEDRPPLGRPEVAAPPRPVDPRALVAALAARLDDRRTDPEERAAVIDALRRLGAAARAAVPTLDRQLDAARDPLERLALAAALLRVAPDGEKATRVLWEAADRPDPDARGTALGFLLDGLAYQIMNPWGMAGPAPARLAPYLSARVAEALATDDSWRRGLAVQVAPHLRRRLVGPAAERAAAWVASRLADATAETFPPAIDDAAALLPLLPGPRQREFVGPLLRRFGDPDAAVRAGAIRGLSRLLEFPPFVVLDLDPGDDPSQPGPASLPDATKLAVADAVIEHLSDPDPDVRLAALSFRIDGLIKLEGDRRTRYFDSLAGLLDDRPKVRRGAADRLVFGRFLLRDPAGPPTLTAAPLPISEPAWRDLLASLGQLVRDDDPSTRREAVHTLARLADVPPPFLGTPLIRRNAGGPVLEPLGPRDRQLVDLIASRLDDPDAAVRRAAVEAVLAAEQGRPRDPDRLLAAWRAAGDADSDATVLGAFAAELRRVLPGRPVGHDAWRRALTTPDRPGDKVLLEEWLAPPPIGPSPALPYDEARSLADEYLNEVGSPDVGRRRSAALALSRLGALLDEARVRRLLAALGDPDAEVRRLIFRAVRNWVSPPQLPSLIAPAPQAPTPRRPLWPPPFGYTKGPLPLDALGAPDPSWSDVLGWLVGALTKAEYSVRYYPIPGPHLVGPPGAGAPTEPAGIALLTRLEQVRETGDRLESRRDRGELGLLWPGSFAELCARLTGKPSARYRMFLFVLLAGDEAPDFFDAPQPMGIAGDQAIAQFWWYEISRPDAISQVLPAAMRRRRFRPGKVWVVVYDIQRLQGGALKPVQYPDDGLARSLRAGGLGALLDGGGLARPASAPPRGR